MFQVNSFVTIVAFCFPLSAFLDTVISVYWKPPIIIGPVLVYWFLLICERRCILKHMKAFDNHSILLSKLNLCGLKGTAYEFLSLY